MQKDVIGYLYTYTLTPSKIGWLGLLTVINEEKKRDMIRIWAQDAIELGKTIKRLPKCATTVRRKQGKNVAIQIKFRPPACIALQAYRKENGRGKQWQLSGFAPVALSHGDVEVMYYPSTYKSTSS